MINVYCKDRGWLFEDMKGLFRKVGAVTSEEPLPYAKAWICLRTDEWRKCHDPERLVLQIHDMWAHDWPRVKIGAVVRTHPLQCELEASFSMTRPIGALRCMQPLARPPHHPGDLTLGWVGRPANWHDHYVKSPQPLLDAVRQIREARLVPDDATIAIILMGTGLERWAIEAAKIPGTGCIYFDRASFGVETYPSLYAQMDANVITSLTDAGPITLFESLACGIPTLSTDVGWARQMLDGRNGWVYRKPETLSNHIEHLIRFKKNGCLSTPEEISFKMPWRIDGPDGWIEENMKLASLLT